MKDVRQEIGQLRRDESALLERDARQLPDNVMLQYRYAMTLYTVDRLDDALRVLTRAATLDPEAENVLLGLALIYQKQKRLDDARAWTKKLIRLRPDNPSYQALLDELNAAK